MPYTLKEGEKIFLGFSGLHLENYYYNYYTQSYTSSNWPSGPFSIIKEGGANYLIYKDDGLNTGDIEGITKFQFIQHQTLTHKTPDNTAVLGVYNYDKEFNVVAYDNDYISIDANLKDIDKKDKKHPLQYISIDSNNTHFGGKTKVAADVVITGPADKLIDTVTLEMTQGSHKAQAEEVVGLKFGANHTIKLKADSFDFKFTNAEIAASGIDFSKNGVVDFSLVAKVGYSDEEFSVDIGSAEILTQYHLPRYQKLNDRADRKVGGDDWVKPDIIPALKWFSSHNKFEYGDASNMNGGSFKPDHASHRKGLSVDTYVRGYNHKVKDKNGHKKIEVTINGVKKIAKAIDNSPYQDEIQKIYISYSKTVKHFIEHQINHGHSEYKLFSDHVGHTTHFHLEFFDV